MVQLTAAHRGVLVGFHIELEAAELERYVPLVVVHGDHNVVLSGHSLDENRVRRHRTFNIYALFDSFLDGRYDLGLLLVAEQPIFRAVRVESRDGDPGVVDAYLAHRLVGEAYGGVHPVGLDQVARVAHGHMRRHMDDPQGLAGQQHGVVFGVG